MTIYLFWHVRHVLCYIDQQVYIEFETCFGCYISYLYKIFKFILWYNVNVKHFKTVFLF